MRDGGTALVKRASHEAITKTSICCSASPRWFQEFKASFTYARPQNRKQLTDADIPEVAQLRILRHFFLKSYGLTELFPSSKYLRQAQDNQIPHMIEVEMSTWIVLLLIAWGLDGVARLVDHVYHTKYSIVIAFRIFSWLALLLHIAIAAYFTWAIDQLVDAAVDESSPSTHRYLYLNRIAELESKAADRESANDAIAIMEQVREREQKKRVKRKRNALSQHDTGFQLIGTIFRKLTGRSHKKPAARDELEDASGAPLPVQAHEIQLRWFSRKAWHFVIMSTIMLNGLHVALFCQCVIYQMTEMADEFGGLSVWFLPLPLLINMNIF